MEINEELKSALITDVEQICNIILGRETRIALERCFEITIGTRIKPIEESQPEISHTIHIIDINDDEFNEPSFIKSNNLISAESYFQSRNGGKPSIDMVNDGEHIGATYCVQLMSDYAKEYSQCKQPEIPTDEEIEDESVNQFGDSTNIPEIGFIAGAKWMRDQIIKNNKT